MKSLDLGRGTSENHLCRNASSADMRCKRDELFRLECLKRFKDHVVKWQQEIWNYCITLSGS
jgi:hypothetical protein